MTKRSYEKMKERLKHVIEREFKPEFIGRIDEVVVFRKLTRDDLKQIVDIELAKVYARLAERGLKLELTDEAREFIIDKGGDTDYGARPLRRSVSTYIEDPLSEELLRGAFEGKGRIIVTVKEVADQKQLEFVGTNAPEGELVGAGVRFRKGVDPAGRLNGLVLRKKQRDTKLSMAGSIRERGRPRLYFDLDDSRSRS